MLEGALTAATAAIDEARSIADATGNAPLVNGPMILAAWRGDEARASQLIEASAEEATARGWTSNNYARAVMYNGLGRHDAARDAAWEAFQPDPIGYGTLLVPELAEAASRTGDRVLLESVLQWLSERTRSIRPMGDGSRGARARVAERGRRCRGPVCRSRSRIELHACAARTRPNAAPLWGMVAP